MIRAASLARAIKRLGKIDPLVLVAPGFSDVIAKEIPRIEIVEASEDPSLYREKILDKLCELSPGLLVVDVLPMGLMGELREFLGEFSGKKVLVARRLRQDYRQTMNIDAFVESNYDLVIKAEKMPDNSLPHNRAVEVAPILVRSDSEIFTREQARKKLAVPRRKFLVMAVSTHQPLRGDAFFQMIYHVLMRVGEERTVIKFASPYGEPDPSSAHTSYFPMMELMRGVDLVVGHGGYHLVQETTAVGVPFLAFPEERLYDDQEARLNDRENNELLISFRSPEEAEEKLKKLLTSPLSKRRRAKKFPNGAQTAAQKILELYKPA